MSPLNFGYSVDVDNVNESKWIDIIRNFDDAVIFGTWTYGVIRRGEKNLSHLVLKRYGQVVAAAQAWVIKLPIIGTGVAHIKWGPMWQLRGQKGEPEIYRLIVKALNEEYVVKRGLLLRIVPNGLGEDGDLMGAILEEEGFKRQLPAEPYRTLIVDLSPSIDDLYKGLKRVWRQNLRHAENNGLVVVEGVSDDLFEVVTHIYSEMQKQKKFADNLPVRDLRAIQKDLPDDHKMKILICDYKGEPVSARVTSLIGNIGIDLVAATKKTGRDMRSSYLLQWRMLEWLKSAGCRCYDLTGLHEDKRTGVNQFKYGFAGKHGIELSFEEFEKCQNIIASLAVKTGNWGRATYRKGKGLVCDIRRQFG